MFNSTSTPCQPIVRVVVSCTFDPGLGKRKKYVCLTLPLVRLSFYPIYFLPTTAHFMVYILRNAA